MELATCEKSSTLFTFKLTYEPWPKSVQFTESIIVIYRLLDFILEFHALLIALLITTAQNH